MVESVGIRQVQSDGVKLTAAMILNVTGGGMTYVEAEGSTPAHYLLSVASVASLATLTARVTAAENAATTLTGRVTAAENAAAALALRVAALEAKQFTTTDLKVANYTAVAWEHVLVSSAVAGTMSVTLPASSGPTAGARVRVTDIGPVGNAEALAIVCTFYSGVGYYATSPYVVADSGGATLAGASIELLDTGAGWVIVQESCKPSLLL
jgi:hypothetical protein